jgi:hypothetical protein
LRRSGRRSGGAALPAEELLRKHGVDSFAPLDPMDHYIPKRRVPVTLWTRELDGVAAHVFLDLDARGERHPTLLDMLNQSHPFLPVVVGDEGRVHLFRRTHLVRVTPGRQALASDLYARGFREWREERVELALADGTRLAGRVWMPLERQSQRLSDFLNQLGSRFFVLITPAGTHFVNASAVVQVELDEGAGAPLGLVPRDEHEHANGAGAHADHGAPRAAAADGTVS